MSLQAGQTADIRVSLEVKGDIGHSDSRPIAKERWTIWQQVMDFAITMTGYPADLHNLAQGV